MADEIVGSKMPSLASDALKATGEGYGQNAFDGASSDLPGKRTESGFLKTCDGVPSGDWQTRKVSSEQYPTAHGLAKRDCTSSIPDNGRPVKEGGK